MHNPTAAEQRWIYVLTGSLILSLILFAWMTRRSLCFESKNVRVISWSLGPASEDIYRCQARKHVPFKDDLSEALPHLSDRLQLLDNFGEFYLRDLWGKARIRIRVEESAAREQVSLADHPEEKDSSIADVLLFEDEIETEGLLEARILSAVISQSLESLKIKNSASVELFKTYLGNLAGYDDEKADLLDWKLSLYSEAVKHARRGLALREQEKILSDWRELVLSGQAPNWEIPKALVSPMHEALALFGYRQNKKLFQVPFAVYFADGSVKLGLDDKKRLHRQLAAVLYRDRVLFPFSHREYSRTELEPIQVGRLVLFQCGLPKMDQLDFMGIEFEHLLFAQSCAKPDLDMVVSALRSPKVFAASYPDVDFVQVHMPSLRMVLAKSGGDRHQILSLFNDSSMLGLKKMGLLTEISSDDKMGTKSWKGALEPLPLFRLKSLENRNL